MIDPIGKAEAMRLLGIAPATMTRWMKSGKLKCERSGTGKFDPVYFERADVLAFVPILPTVGFEQAAPAPQPKRNPAPSKVGHYEDAAPEPTFAEQFKAGEATDSCGNTIYGANEQYPTTGATLLGPVVPVERPPAPGLFDHMDPATLGATEIGSDGQPIFDGSSDSHPLNVRAIALGHLAPQKPAKSRHPNASRQEFLNLIFSDVRRGYSR